jgi:hypothetical protein
VKSKLQTIVDDNPVWRDAFKASSLKVAGLFVEADAAIEKKAKVKR